MIKFFFILGIHKESIKRKWQNVRSEKIRNTNEWKLATVIEGDQETPFSIATAPRC